MMELIINSEWLKWGDKDTDYVGFFAPIKSAEFTHDSMIYVDCKYGKYCVNPIDQKVSTIEGVDHAVLVEVAKYGMGFKFWEVAL